MTQEEGGGAGSPFVGSGAVLVVAQTPIHVGRR